MIKPGDLVEEKHYYAGSTYVCISIRGSIGMYRVLCHAEGVVHNRYWMGNDHLLAIKNATDQLTWNIDQAR